MISVETNLRVIDNSGGKKVRCIKIFKKGSFTSTASVGDIIIVAVKRLRKKNRYRSKVKKGDVLFAVVVHTKAPIHRSYGVSIKFADNSVVLLNKNFKPIGTRIFSVVPKELRLNNFSRVMSLSAGIV